MATLITGATGFVGGHLLEHLLGEGESALIATNRSADWPKAIAHLASSVRLIACDLSHPAAVTELLQSVKPRRIYHLAGFADNGASFRQPEECWRQNVFIAQYLYEAAAKVTPDVRIVTVSTGLIYGEPEGPDQAFHEASPLKPGTPYAASKAAADLMAYQYFRSHDLAIVRARPFNHIGPRQPTEYAVPNFARQVAAIMRGKSDPVMETGDLSAQRDLTDVRDIVRGYRMLMDKGRPGEAYNLGRGETFSMRSIVERLIAASGKSVAVRERAAVRKGDPNVIRCDIHRIKTEIGWAPEASIDQSLSDILRHWLSTN